MHQNTYSNENICNETILTLDKLHMQKIVFEFEELSKIDLDDENVEELLQLLTESESIKNSSLEDIFKNKKLLEIWLLLTQFFKFENCSGCINHTMLSFQFAVKILYTVPNSIYLFFIPTNKNYDSCPLICLIFKLNKLIYKNEQDLFDNNELLSFINFLQKKDHANENSNDENLNILLLNHFLNFIQTLFFTIDNLSFVFDTNFKTSEYFLISMKYILNLLNPMFQTINSSKLIIEQNENFISDEDMISFAELRILTFKILERFISIIYGTQLFNVFISTLDKEIIKNRGTFFETLMDILSPDFPLWFTKKYHDKQKQKHLIYSIQLQYNALSFLFTLFNHWNFNSVINVLLSIKKHYISLDELPDFISKNNFYFNDVKDKLFFDKEKSIFTQSKEVNEFLPQYCNSIFSTLFYRIVSLALHNGLKLQQNTIEFTKIRRSVNNNIVEETTIDLKKSYMIKLDIIIISIRIISFIFTSIIKISDKDTSDIKIKKFDPLYQVITSFSTYLIWICEFVFDYKSQIPQLYHVLEEINMIKIRLPILFNAFNIDENDSNCKNFA